MSSSTLFALTISTILIILGLLFQKNKWVFKLQIIWAWILLAFNTGGMDYFVHYNIFMSSSLNIFSFFSSGLYVLICYIFKLLSLNFFTMNFILNTVAVVVIYFIIKKTTNRISLVGALFLIYPIIENIIQKRNFFASIFILLAFYLLINKNEHYQIKSFILILIASLIHQTSYFYFILWFLQQLDIKKIKKIIVILVPISFLLIPFIPKIALLIFPASKVKLYFYDLKLDLFDSICWIILHILFVFLISLFHKNIIYTDEKNKLVGTEIYKMNIVSLLILPFYYYEATFIRIYRNLMLFNYVLVSNYKNGKLTKNNLYLFVFWICYLIAVFLMIYVFTGIGFEKLVSPEFDNNLIINKIMGG